MFTASDADDVRHLLRDLLETYPGADSWLERRLTEVSEGTAWGTLERAASGAAVAVALGVSKPGHRFKISTLFVHPDHRRGGHGRALLRAALAASGDRQAYITVSDRARPALEPLLRGMGFRLVAVSHHRYMAGHDELVYSMTPGQ